VAGCRGTVRGACVTCVMEKKKKKYKTKKPVAATKGAKGRRGKRRFDSGGGESWGVSNRILERGARGGCQDPRKKKGERGFVRFQATLCLTRGSKKEERILDLG